MDNILTSIKKLLGISEDYHIFDNDIIMHINTAFAILNQIGIGPTYGYAIEGYNETWDEYISTMNLHMVKTFIFLSVKIAFDPPSSSALLENMNSQLAELTWRLELEGQHNRSNDERG